MPSKLLVVQSPRLGFVPTTLHSLPILGELGMTELTFSETRILGLYNDTDCFNWFATVHQREGRTDRQTDRQTDGRTDGRNELV